MPLTISPVTPERWSDLLDLFGANGAYSNCWCTWWIMTGRDWDAAGAEGRRAVLEDLVASGEEPGLLAYREGAPVGWCAVGPRRRYARMMSPRAVVYRPLDDRPSWVVNCFFVAKQHRGTGIAPALLAAAVDYAFGHGAERIEAYPLDPATRPHTTRSDLFVGSLSMFLDAGFTEIRRIKDRPIVARTKP